MIADHFTKPLQGTLFRKLRAQIQGIPDKSPEPDMAWRETESVVIPSPQECVRKNIKQNSIVKIQSQPNVKKLISHCNYSIRKVEMKDELMRHRNYSFRKDRVSYANVVKGVRGEE